MDNDLGYEPGNCKWQTKRQQQRNRRGNRKYDSVRLIKAYTGRDLSLRQMSHQVVASLRSIPTKGRGARTPEDIIAACLVWLSRNGAEGATVRREEAERAKIAPAKRKKTTPSPVQVPEKEPPSDDPNSPATWTSEAYETWLKGQKKRRGAIHQPNETVELTP
jgi:hypothetical protein